ncbi:MAG: transposase, partial [Candidatus Woesearchaeota archaeon]
NITNFELNNSLIWLKTNHPELKQVHSQVLQDVNQRIAYAFDNFFRRVKKHDGEPGYPRFKGRNHFKSITYPQSGFSLDEKLHVSKIGDIKISRHREIDGMIKIMNLKKTSSGKWLVSFSVETKQKQIIRPEGRTIGLDLGLLHFYADSEGNFVDNPRWLRNSEQKLAHLHRSHSKKKKGGKNGQKSRLKVARHYEKISNQRNDFIHKESRRLATSHSFIAVEKLSISKMVHNRYLSKSISDAGWRKFIQALAYKVEETGGKMVEVDARGTSQYCSCGNRVKKSLAVRIHRCNKCGIEMDRDTMSAMIIKHIALTGTTAGSAGSNAWEDVSALSSMSQELSLHSS